MGEAVRLFAMAYLRRSLAQFIDHEDPAWPVVQGWIGEAKHTVEILSPSETPGESLVSTQTTTRSPLGAVVLHTGLAVATLVA